MSKISGASAVIVLRSELASSDIDQLLIDLGTPQPASVERSEHERYQRRIVGAEHPEIEHDVVAPETHIAVTQPTTHEVDRVEPTDKPAALTVMQRHTHRRRRDHAGLDPCRFEIVADLLHSSTSMNVNRDVSGASCAAAGVRSNSHRLSRGSTALSASVMRNRRWIGRPQAHVLWYVPLSSPSTRRSV